VGSGEEREAVDGGRVLSDGEIRLLLGHLLDTLLGKE
jgi:hypothetical protein